MSTAANPWNAVYNFAGGKRNTTTQMTTLRKPEGTLTTDTRETLHLMLDNFTPEDNEQDDSDYHKQIRTHTQQPTTRANDREFTIEEIRDAIESMDNKKAPGKTASTATFKTTRFKYYQTP